MNWSEMSLTDYQNALASDDPTPGGGTASAVALGHSAALVAMVANLTIGNKKWADGWEIAKHALQVSQKIMTMAGDLAEQDSDAFDDVMAAFRLPKLTDEDIKTRREHIRNSTLKAAQIPYKTAEFSLDLLNSIKQLSLCCNGNAISDLGVAALLASASCKGALFNVEINLNSIPEEMGHSMRDNLSSMNEECRHISKKVMHTVKERL